METVLEILKFTLPSLILLGAVYFLLKDFMKADERKMISEMKKNSQQTTIPARLQAYERLTLFLERISPPNLVVRVSKAGMEPRQLHSALAQSIREEFEHNLSQQLYVSDDAWSLVKNAKEEVIKAVNLSLARQEEKSSSTEVAAKIIEDWTSRDIDPIRLAQRQLKKEVNLIF